MPEARQKSPAGAAIVCGVLMQGFAQRVLGGRRHEADAQIAGDAGAIRVGSLPPSAWEIRGLIDGPGDGRARQRGGTDGVVLEVLQLLRFGGQEVRRG